MRLTRPSLARRPAAMPTSAASVITLAATLGCGPAVSLDDPHPAGSSGPANRRLISLPAGRLRAERSTAPGREKGCWLMGSILPTGSELRAPGATDTGVGHLAGLEGAGVAHHRVAGEGERFRPGHEHLARVDAHVPAVEPALPAGARPGGEVVRRLPGGREVELGRVVGRSEDGGGLPAVA